MGLQGCSRFRGAYALGVHSIREPFPGLLKKSIPNRVSELGSLKPRTRTLYPSFRKIALLSVSNLRRPVVSDGAFALASFG